MLKTRNENAVLAGRRVVITGGARGIGFETARQLVAAGAKVALLDHDAEAVDRARSALAANASSFVADVTDAQEVSDAVDQAALALDGVDIVFANAGIAPRTASTVASSPDGELERVMAVNVSGAWNTARAGLRHLQPGGRLVLTASIYAFANGMFMAPYAASKAAVESLGRSLRVELAPQGVGVTVAYFGPVDTAFARAFDEDPVAEAVQAVFPAPLVERITPQQAAAALVDGVARGKSRVIAPRRWVAMELLRGPVGRAGDAALARNRAIADLVRGEAARHRR